MPALNFSLSHLLADLTATKSTSITAVAVLLGTFLPLVGGPIKPYEVREFRAGVAALMNGETSTPQLAPAYHPQWGGAVQLTSAPAGAARVIRTVYTPASEDEGEIELTGAVANQAAEPPPVAPVAQVFEAPIEICADDCEAELAFEEPELAEIPEVEEIEESAGFEAD